MCLFRRRSRNLLPDDAYPRQMTAERRARVDREMRELLPLMPDLPGDYEDATGDRWTLGPDGSWTDHRGETRDRRYTPILTLMGPWTPID